MRTLSECFFSHSYKHDCVIHFKGTETSFFVSISFDEETKWLVLLMYIKNGFMSSFKSKLST